jgi:hypothetical protein
MFTYEFDRMIRKQQKFVKTRAYRIIQELEAKSLDNSEQKACLTVLLDNPDNTETQKDVLTFAKNVIENR